MSGKKSWDIAPARKRAAPAPPSAPAPAARTRERPRRPAASTSPAPARRPLAVRPPSVPTAPLAERRRGARRARAQALAALLAISCLAAVGLMWIPALRIRAVTVQGADATSVRSIVDREIAGTYAFLIPRDSIFAYPKQRVAAAVLAATPELKHVAITRTSFSAISVEAMPRTPAFVWCGADQSTPADSCYYGDPEGFIFSEVQSDATTGTTTLPRVFAPFEEVAVQEPVGQHLAVRAAIERVLAMVRAIESLSLPIAATALRGDEVDLTLTNGTRIVYLLGQEHEAMAVAKASLPGLDLSNGGYAYVDLRFDGKAYAMPRVSTP